VEVSQGSFIGESIKDYYGKVLKSKEDLKTSACCSAENIPANIKPLFKNIHSEVLAKFYGCGVPLPSVLKDKTVLDLGCGSGRDAYILSQLVGPKGRVVGVDMTEKQLLVARKHIDYHTKAFGYKSSNVDFKNGYIEDLNSVGIEDSSVDVVVSNCVINLSMNKEKVFKEIFRVLKPGGELYFSDIFSDKRIDKKLCQDPVLVGECLAGAMYIEDFRRVLRQIGCLDYRIIAKSSVEISDNKIYKKIGMVNFASNTIRAFKCDFEDLCEDYGHIATYKGSIEGSEHGFVLDDHHVFKTKMPMRVCGNTAKMLTETRFSSHFDVTGDFKNHFGLFACDSKPSLAKFNGGCC
jgi:arsenite methyltransferase